MLLTKDSLPCASCPVTVMRYSKVGSRVLRQFGVARLQHGKVTVPIIRTVALHFTAIISSEKMRSCKARRASISDMGS